MISLFSQKIYILGIIKVENIRVYANHGCLKEETKIGSDYRVDLKVKADLQKSAQSDALVDTVDYVLLNKIVVEEMAISSALLESVAKRIIDRIFAENKLVTVATVALSKMNPPIGGDVEMVTIEISEKRKA